MLLINGGIKLRTIMIEFYHLVRSSIKYRLVLPGLIVLFITLIAFADSSSFEKISERVFLFRDTVNVYVIKEGNRCVLIDFGSGRVLDHLDEIGVDEIDWIVHTHHHRDQCQGDYRAVEMDIPIAVPKKEAWLFESADEFWLENPIYNVYMFKPTTFTSTRVIPVARELSNYSYISSQGHKFKVINTPGHTHGSISLLLDVDEKRIAFTGDLIHAEGTVHTYYDLMYRYNDNGKAGMELTEKSLSKTLRESPDLFLPSHGPVIHDPEKNVKLLETRFERIKEVFEFNRYNVYETHPLPHLWHYPTSFFIISESGRSLMIDYAGVETPGNFGFAGKASLKKVRRKAGVSSFDVIIPTHYHDDHVGGIPQLVEQYGTKIWAFENMVDILENPSRYHMACTVSFPVHVDRTLSEGESFDWEEFSFQIFHFPGQTELHAAIATEIDGKKVVFIGDSMFPTDPLRGESFNALNWCRLEENEGYIKCAKKLKELSPDYAALGHHGLVPVNDETLDEWLEWTRSIKDAITPAVARENVNFGTDPNWVSFYPYRVEVGPGDRIGTSVEVRNYLEASATVKISLVAPSGWRVEPVSQEANLKAKEISRIPFALVPPENLPLGRTVITADVVWQGKHRGELAEMIIDHGFTFRSWNPDTNLIHPAYTLVHGDRRWLKASLIP